MPYIEGDGGQKGRKSWRPVKATPRDTNHHSTALGQLSVYTNLIAGLIPVQNRLPFACPTALNTNANNATTFVGLDMHVHSIKDCAFAPATDETERKSLGCDHQQARIVDEVPAPACETRLRVRRDRLPPVPQAARHGRRLRHRRGVEDAQARHRPRAKNGATLRAFPCRAAGARSDHRT